MAYLTPDDPQAFYRMRLKPRPVSMPSLKHWCPQCRGYGGWRLQLNSHGPGRHFTAHCSQCNGWGWVNDSDATCVHDWHETNRNLGRCMHEYKCSKCPRIQVIDSSG